MFIECETFTVNMLISSRQRWISFTSQSLLRIGAFQKCKSDTSTEETQPPVLRFRWIFVFIADLVEGTTRFGRSERT